MKHPARIIVSVACLLAALLVLQFRSQGEAIPLRRTLEGFPADVGVWHGREATRLEVEVLNILKVSDYLMRRYVDPSGRSLWLYIGYWQSQRKGAQMHSPKNCLPGSGWEPVEASMRTVPLGSGRELTVNRYVVQKGAAREVVFYWYRSQGADVAGEVGAKLIMVKNAVTRNRTDGALIRVSTPVYSTPAEASERLVAYVRALYPVLDDYLPQ